VQLQEATPIVGARRPRVIAHLVFALVTVVVTLHGEHAHASDQHSRTGNCAAVSSILTKATSGLLMPSESDHPFTSFTWTDAGKRSITTARVLALTGHTADAAVEVVDLGYFFRNVARHQSWHDRQQGLNVRKFQRLMRVLERHLTDIRVYRIGTIQIDAYIVGRCGRNLAGLSTTLIET
jgi:hypothetical protein